MNAGELVAMLRRLTGLREGDGLFPDDVLLDIVDEANQSLEAERDWPWRHEVGTFNTVAGDRSYDLADFGNYDFYTDEYEDTYDSGSAGTWLKTLGVRVDGDEPMVERTLRDLDQRNPAGSQGRPVEYAVDGGLLYLSPTPDRVYVVHHRFVSEPPRLTSEELEPVMPVLYQRAIVQQAASLVFTRAGDDQRAAAAEAGVSRWRTRMIDDLRRSKGPIRTRVRPGAAL